MMKAMQLGRPMYQQNIRKFSYVRTVSLFVPSCIPERENKNSCIGNVAI